MKKGLVFIIAFAMMTAVSVTSAQAQRSVSLQVFYDELQPYGTWMDHGQYGYVWIPRVGPDFMPYGTNGYWINTQYGNTWVSEYEWGWAPFHYGRWFFDDFYGWIWVPDTVWGPAWVAWRTGGGYYGWAPLMPGLGIHLTISYYNRIPHRYWSFVPYRYVTYRHVYRHCVPRPTVVNIINNTTIITHNHTDRRQTYFTGPSRSDIERRGGGRVVVHSIDESDQPGKTEVTRDGARFYKPQVDESRGSRSRAIPATYVKKNPDGKVETVRSRVDRSTADPNTSRTVKELQRTSRMTDRDNSAEIWDRQPAPAREEQSERKVPTEIQRNDYQHPSPGTLNRYERIQREPTNTARDRYEAPPVQRRNTTREVPRTYTPQRETPQQRTYEAPRTTERQRYVQPQQRNVERQQNTIQRQRTPSYRENSSRSMSQQRTMQYKKSQPSNSGQPNINSGSRSAPSRQRN